MLTPHHLTHLRQDFRTLAHIEYEEVENELLDHYATLTEQRMEVGQDFEHASANAWAELGAGPGLNAIQRDYEKNIRKQISSRHLEILKRYFRWPTVLTTLLVGVLVYIVIPVLADDVLVLILLLSAFIQMAVVQYCCYKSKELAGTSKKIIWDSLSYRAGILLNSAGFFLNMRSTGVIFGAQGPLQINAGIAAILCSIAIIYSMSFIQLYRENFSYKVAH
ncbi:hypothetical protein [Larkinella humicola]|uniref:Uncharacterized protein n=1 Tax=Larkinella humicola TaxID=2607654 RepID=A0A5N1JMK0_9BACT|nr:hypothetical protein [Larkinella humicola]KAA9355193.1 hypothetical protein F0P93_11490 [Larkinella humicola]